MALTSAGMSVSRMVSSNARLAKLSAVSSSILQPALAVPGLTQPQVATLVSTHGQPFPRKAPFDYKNKKYGILRQMFDTTSSRLDENSKIVVVDGNLASGKKEFAQRVAKEFDLKYFPPIIEEDLYTEGSFGFDLRHLNPYLPDKSKFYDQKAFYTDTNASKGTIAIYQMWMYRRRFYQYAEAITHLLNTGQGAVLVRSPYSDRIFAEAMRKMKYITSSALKFYDSMYKNTICEILPPHLTIYLDRPISDVRKSITERGVPHEQSSSTLSDAYLQAIEDVTKKTYLPHMRTTGEVLELDCTDFDLKNEHDFDLIVDDIESLELTGDEYSDATQFTRWTGLNEDMLGYHRKIYRDDTFMQNLFRVPLPNDVPELTMTDDDLIAYREIVEKNPLFEYDLKYSPERNSYWQIALKW